MAKLTTRTAILASANTFAFTFSWSLIRTVREGVPEGATVLVANLPGVPKEGTFTHPAGNRGWVVNRGWNGSYHDAQYDPYMVAWAKGPASFRRARRMLRAAQATLATVDTAVARFQARNQVRPGD